jgi:hypothetical protein
MNNRFQEIAEKFLKIYMDDNGGAEWDDEELERQIRSYLYKQGIDEVWMDEAYEVVYDTLGEANDWS